MKLDGQFAQCPAAVECPDDFMLKKTISKLNLLVISHLTYLHVYI
jgi:hypothetical protein